MFPISNVFGEQYLPFQMFLGNNISHFKDQLMRDSRSEHLFCQKLLVKFHSPIKWWVQQILMKSQLSFPITTSHFHEELKIQNCFQFQQIYWSLAIWISHFHFHSNIVFTFNPIMFSLSANRLVLFPRGQEQLRPEGQVRPWVPELHQGALGDR